MRTLPWLTTVRSVTTVTGNEMTQIVKGTKAKVKELLPVPDSKRSEADPWNPPELEDNSQARSTITSSGSDVKLREME
jgi:hypothetical protein